MAAVARNEFPSLIEYIHCCFSRMGKDKLRVGGDMAVEDSVVSVIIPTYNGERFLGRTLASALAQTYDPLEIVVVDDGSIDRTPIIVEAAAARDSRIRFLRMQQSGVAAARNFGISRARGNLIAPLDADDLWHPEKIARQVGVMKASTPVVGLVYCWSIRIDENDFLLEAAVANSTPQGLVTEELAKSNFLHTSSSPLIKRSCIDAIGGYDAGLRHAEDWKLYLALSEICEFAVVPEYLVGYRQWSASLTRDIPGLVQSLELFTQWLLEKWPDIPKEISRERTHRVNAYLARLAFEQNQFLKALCYEAIACKARPAMLLERSSFEFGARLLARMAGLRSARKRRVPPISFEEFHATKQVRMNS
jgi:glycosyltransferase involved in cell wall biosynthesis